MFCVSVFFFSSRRRHTRLQGDWSSDVCSSDLLRFTRTTPRDCAMGYERNIHRTSDQGEFLAVVSPSSAGEKVMTPSPSPFGQRSEPHSQHFQNATKGGNEFVAIWCNATRRINAVQNISMSRLRVNHRR